ncbi:helix-turn-helix transcriptional regulator [Kitasatospora sp. CM 4170]|uniref:Helix-turn-helix transcriptional regulator n=1 Tax=Kitasatospora aburaviensis TaxID=67265 RepID=A0ABW1F0N1_9ACTN|nr:helix-turn-helix transcriptional regulator [Kitasatospora sp. CM 4170]WNM49334.1 helix-turn-helix transcriptional regulator [Kitasatospora sp. CM 4170]
MEQTTVDVLSSPAIRFGQELHRSRRARGWSQVGLSKRMGYSNTLVSYVERAKRAPTKNFAVKADEVFETGGTFYELWRRHAKASLLEGFPEFAEAEARCRRLRELALTIVTGLFQVREYAEALAYAAVQRGAITQSAADQRVDFLAARQRLLERTKPPLIHVVLDESCLVRTVGGKAVMLRQLDHIAELAARPNITVQVAPFHLGEHLPFKMPVTLLDLPDGSVVGYAESHARGHLERKRETITAWEREYDQLVVEALPKAASLALIHKARKELAP